MGKGRVKYVKKKKSEESKTPAYVSSEQGFTGDSKSWFSGEDLKSQFSHFTKSAKDEYFNSYSSLHVHETMLKDRIRTETYKRACLDNCEQFRDKVVLDIGCGTGVLSIFAARAGAKHVYAIDNAEITEIVSSDYF